MMELAHNSGSVEASGETGEAEALRNLECRSSLQLSATFGWVQAFGNHPRAPPRYYNREMNGIDGCQDAFAPMNQLSGPRGLVDQEEQARGHLCEQVKQGVDSPLKN